MSGAFCCANKNLSRLIYSPEKAGEKVARQRWEEWVNDENRLAVLQAWARAGLSDERIAKHIGISRSTLNEWKKKHQSIRDALKPPGRKCVVPADAGRYCKGEKTV